MLKRVRPVGQGWCFGVLLLVIRPRDRLEKVDDVVIHDLRQEGHGPNGDVLLARLNQRKVLLRQSCQGGNFGLRQARLKAGLLEISAEKKLKIFLRFLALGDDFWIGK